MATKRERSHIYVNADQFRKIESYKPYRRTITPKRPGEPSVGRAVHSLALESSINAAVGGAHQRKQGIAISVPTAKPGIYLEFESIPGWELAISGLENRRLRDRQRHIEAVAVSDIDTVDENGNTKLVQHATVFVPDGQIGHFFKQLEKYALATPKKKNERRHENTYDRIATLQLATLRALWTDSNDAYPVDEDEAIWWEVWLRRTDGRELDRFHQFATLTNIRLIDRRLQFDDRIVTLAFASTHQLSASIDVLNDLAELRRAKEVATFFIDQSPKDQAEWVKDLVSRCKRASDGAPTVCILDTGVNHGHPLLEGTLADEDCHSIESTWGKHDHDGHGTEMAGLALYGDLVPILTDNQPVVQRIRLESVKILPPKGSNDPDLYGAITAEATSRVEIQAVSRKRTFSMAVTARDTRDRGQPTSWSSAVDALAAGRSFDQSSKGLVYLDDDEVPHQRLFVISAGNIEETSLEKAHLDRSDTEPVHDPAQAWNALTVGAYTEKAVIEDSSWNGWTPVAMPGDLSPWSTTSVVFAKQWPFKPDVVAEGGNVVHNAAYEVDFPCDDLNLLTTYYKPSDKLLVTTWATSAATAQVARISASVSSEYPNLWPETVRGLVVNSAEWTPAMKSHLAEVRGKTARTQLIRRYGFGVPSLERALKSAGNAVTLVVQDTIRPFIDGKMREIHLHDLPWPRDVLASLGEANVKVRVTLSYFVEPNPGRRGWQQKHRYQSHGLRFDVKGPTESTDEFRKRLNQKALEEEEEKPTKDNDGSEWYLGERARNRGSLHSDILHGFAADIAERGVIAIYPVTGWWKELKKRDRSEQGARYALIVSIETDAVDADIWTPINAQVRVPVEISVSTENDF